MANSKENTRTEGIDSEEYVDYILPRLPGKNGARHEIVSVNGEEIRIQRGVKVKIKRKFAEVLDHSVESDEGAQDYIDYKSKG